MHKYLVEFLGTLFLAFVIFATGNWMAIGAALGVAVLLGGPISKGSFNPAVTLALFYAGKISKTDVIPYIVVEILGGIMAFFIYKHFYR
jgi:aquaporin Z